MKNRISKEQIDKWEELVSQEKVQAYGWDYVDEDYDICGRREHVGFSLYVYDYDYKHDFSSLFHTLRTVGVEIDEDTIEDYDADFDDYLEHSDGSRHRYTGRFFGIYLLRA